MEPSVKRDLKICLNGHASVTKMAAIILVENHLQIFFRIKRAFSIEHRGLELILYLFSMTTVKLAIQSTCKQSCSDFFCLLEAFS